MKLNVILGLVSLVCVSCGGELSYKRGARPQELSAIKNLCKSEGLKTEKEMSACLEKNGWSVHQFNDLDLFAVTSSSDNRADVTANITLDTPEEESPTTPIAKKMTPPPSANVKSQTDHHDKKTDIKIAEKTTPASTTPVKKVSLLKPYVINSWWKFGSNANLLTKNTDECIATLGPEHTPNAKTQTYTRGFVICMHKKGWKALRSQ